MSDPSYPIPSMPVTPQPATLWSTPIDPLKWPTGRWATQIISGVLLVLFFGFAFLLFHHPLALLFTVPTLGLCLACMLNGIKVARKQRRYTTLGVLRIMLALALVGIAVQPGLGLFTQVAVHRMSGNHEKLKETQKALAERPNDFRCEPARWLLASGMRSQYEPVLAAFEQDPVDKAGVDPKFREAFRAWLDDLSRSGSPLLVVKLQEDIDATEPASAKVELMIWQNDPTLKHLNWTGKHEPLRPKAFADLPEGFEDKALDDHRKAAAAALKKQFGALLSDKLADWKSERDAGTSKAPTIALHGRYKHSGTFVKMGERGHFAPLMVMPAVSWDIKLYDRRDKLLGETTITNLVDKDFNWKQTTGPVRIYQHLGTYDAVLSMVYGRTAWDVMRRTGLDAGPPPTVFP